ncbi:MAG TPA: hypothetical protein PLL88_08120 [Anaerolineaceae bacterium]|nr:hypothetical protein [Anaerolineaceae bacterium]
MNLETIVKRMDDLEERIKNFDNLFKTFQDKLADLDTRVANLPAEYRDIKDEVAQLKKSVANAGNVDKALLQIRKDTNEKIIALEKESKKQQEQQSKLQQTDIKALSAKIDLLDTKIKSELDKRIRHYVDEDSHLLATVEKIEQSVNTKLRTDDDIRRTHEIQKRDIQNMSKRIEIIADDMNQFRNQQVEITEKIGVLLESTKRAEVQIAELKSTETQRKMSQTAFIEQQEVAHKQREIYFNEIQRRVTEEFQKISLMLERLGQKEKELNQTGNNLDEMTTSYERRLREVTELYQLFEAKYQKEWGSFKNEIEKDWSNFSLINDEKQSALTARMDDLRSNIVLLEDQTNDLKELLGLMSSEIQKGMLSLMKMATAWKDAFDHIEGK